MAVSKFQIIQHLDISMRKKKKYPNQIYHVKAEYWLPAKTGMATALEKFNLTFASDKTPLLGDTSCSSATEKQYLSVYRALRYYCCLVGDYESLLMLQEDSPKPFCPSMKANTIGDFIQWKRGTAKAPLLNKDRQPVCDVFGHHMLCLGGWNAPMIVKQFKSAVTALHQVNEQRGQYYERCENCWELGFDSIGCIHHLYQPQLWRKGDPTQSRLVQMAHKRSSKDGEGYQEGGDTALTPMELLRIRRCLVSTGDIKDYQLWVLILISIRLFLRSAEATGDQTDMINGETIPTGLTGDSFVQDLFVVSSEGIVDALAIKVKG